MSDKIKDIAQACTVPVPIFHGLLVFLDKNIKKPMQGTIIDKFVFEPAKQYYVQAKRLD
jgi:hypothetical protein